MPQDARIYLDYNATTPVDPEVFEAMVPYFREHFGNPASGQHAWGWTAEAAVTKARTTIANFIGSRNSEIYFNSGATEGNNTALFGVVQHLRATEPRDHPLHIITSNAEHNSVKNASKALQQLGVEVDFIPVNADGCVNPALVEKAIKPHTRLMSFIWVNNEIGSVNPIARLAAIAKAHRVYLHTDATQAIGKIPVDVRETPVDLMSFSGHKFYGPKGVGVLYVRSRDPAVTLWPLLHGGGQEQGLRSGTLNVPAIVGLGKAIEICAAKMTEEANRTKELRDRLFNGVKAKIPDVRLNGHPIERSPTNLSLTFPGRPVDLALPKLQRLGFSTGSACSAGRGAVSSVLTAIGLSEKDAGCTIRLSIGRTTTSADVDQTIEILGNAFSAV